MDTPAKKERKVKYLFYLYNTYFTCVSIPQGKQLGKNPANKNKKYKRNFSISSTTKNVAWSFDRSIGRITPEDKV